MEHTAIHSLHVQHDQFLETGRAPEEVRTVIADSWLRSAAAGLDAEATVPPVLTEHRELADYRAAHPLSQVFPLLYDVLGRAAEDSDCVMAIGDADGQLLWVCGQPGVLRRAAAINFVEGSVWDESRAGTNAPGTALRLDAPVQIHAAEHFSRLVQPWSCSAAPIHDPETREILGIVDITGGDDVASVHTLAMIRAAARMAESELGRLAAVGAMPARPAGLWRPHQGIRASEAVLRVQALGRLDCDVELDERRLRLSPRHSDILVALLQFPEGLTGDQLALQVYAADVHPSTMRAEMTRLRALLGSAAVQSRPYRLTVETNSDWQSVAAHLVAGRTRQALRAYAGPLLPQSEAPVVAAMRERLRRDLRAAVLASGLPELMVAWTRTRWGAEDLAVWQRQAAVLPPASPLRASAIAEARRLERDLGAR